MLAKTPPPLPATKNWRWAAALNLFLPGAGLFYLGRRKLGAALGLAFLICLVGALGAFLSGYLRYLNVVLGSDLMQEGNLEQIKYVFHTGWLLGFLTLGLGLHFASMIALSRARKGSLKPRPDDSL